MNKKQLLSLILSVIMMLSISFPAGVLADGEEAEPAEQEPIVLVEEQEEEPAAEEVKDGEENAETSEPKDAAITITTQPTSKTAVAGEQVKLSVAATTTSGTLTYQWQYKKKTDDDTKWTNASGKAAEWNLTVQAVHFTFDFRCKISNGTSTVYSNVVNVNQRTVTITTQPTSKTASVGDKVALTVAATTTTANALTYQWQYKAKTATSWNNASGKTATWNLTVVAAHFTYDFRCKVSDGVSTVYTNKVNINQAAVSTITITTQPTSKTASVGDKVALTVAATTTTGNALTYQWQYKKKDSTTWSTGSGKAATWNLTVQAVHFTYDFRCKITDGTSTEYSNVVNISENVAPAITITTQPTSQSAAAGAKVTLSVVATADTALTYQWQYKKKTATTWSTGSGKTAAWNLTVQAVHFTYDFRCKITDAENHVVYTDIVNINECTIAITTQPTSKTASVGDKVTLSVAATTTTGNALTYQWQYKKKTATTWSTGSGKTANWQLTVQAAHFTYDFRCKITDGTSTVYSNVVNIDEYIAPPIVITTQPTSQNAAVGAKVTLSVVAEGTGLSYQWQYRKPNATTWTNASGKTATWNLTVVAAHYTYDFRCKITDAENHEEFTEIVNISEPPITITTQPVSQTVAVGAKANLSVVAEGNGLTYQWQYKKKTATTWSNSTAAAAKTANWDLTVVASHYTFDFRCKITDADNNVEYTEIVNIDEPYIVITTQPTSQVGAVGSKVTLSVAATGKTALTYQWQYKKKTATSWTNASGKTASWQLTVQATHYTFDFQCVIKDAENHTVTTEIVNINPIGITTQPTDKIAAIGDKVTLSVVATGSSALTYQWQYKKKTATSWTNASGKTANWQLTVVAAHYTYDFQCVISDASGNSVTTNTVHINDMSSAEPFTVSGVTYLAISASTCKVVSYSGTAASLTIPGTAKGLTVVEIGEEAFMGNTTLSSIDLPDSITIIRARAFKGCTSLSDMH